MNLIELTELIRKGENEHVEFKRNVDERIGRTICAFLNTDGGKIAIGVEDNGQIVGCAKDAEEKLGNLISAISPRHKVDIDILFVEDRKIVIVTVPKSERLHAFGNIGYIRIGSTSRELMLDEIAEKAAESLLLKFDEALCIDANENDISGQIFEEYINKRMEIRGVEKPAYEKKKVLEMIKATYKGKVTNAGVIFFCDHPERFHMQAELRFIEFKSQDMRDVLEEKMFTGSIWRISDDAGKFIENKIPREATIKGFDKIVSPKFPIEALREAINNALIHRNYFDPADIRIFLFPDRIEVVNPGSFPADVTPEMPVHRPRNPLLSQYFFDIGKIEKYGSGLLKMRSMCKEGGYQEPEFVLKARQTKVIFHFIPIKLREALKKLDETDKKIINAINEKETMKTGELLGIISMSRDSLVERINKLVGSGLIEKKGRGRGIYYSIS
jgi:ATP-dependent DNA helicase RecG